MFWNEAQPFGTRRKLTGDFDRLEMLSQIYRQNQRAAVRSNPLLPAFIISSLILAPVAAGIFYLTVRNYSPSILSSPLQMNYWGGDTKRDFLSSLSIDSRREAAGTIHFLRDVIGASRPDAAELVAHAIVSESLRAGYDPIFVAAVVLAESTFNQRARSSAGALGLMQLLPNTAQYISEKRGFEWRGVSTLVEDPAYNVRLGIAYLKYLERHFPDDRRNILVAYNWGPTNLSNALKKNGSIPSVSKKYAEKILSLHKRWSQDFEVKRKALRFADLGVLAG